MSETLNTKQTTQLDTSDGSNRTCGKENRYCKGCLCDVTETMFCYCGEITLTKESTYTDEDLKYKTMKYIIYEMIQPSYLMEIKSDGYY